jgi:hypothetical protein
VVEWKGEEGGGRREEADGLITNKMVCLDVFGQQQHHTGKNNRI